MSNSSFVNGIIVGAGIVLAIMSYGFLLFIAPIENQEGVSSTEIRVAIMLGGLVAAASIGYEYYLNKNSSKSTKQEDTDKLKIESDKAAQEAEDAVKAAEEAESLAKEAIAKAAAAKDAESNPNKESQQVDSESQKTDKKDE